MTSTVPGARCPGCATATFTGWRRGDGRLLLRCGDCDRVAYRIAPDEYAHRPADHRCHEHSTWPQPGPWQWAGFVRDGDGRWMLAAVADSPTEAFDALDSSWVSGARLVVPVRPAPATNPGGETDAEPRPSEEACRRCGSADVAIRWRTLKGGCRALWAWCRRCDKGIRALPQTAENVRVAAAHPAGAARAPGALGADGGGR
jgi:hypothetical protein